MLEATEAVDDDEVNGLAVGNNELVPLLNENMFEMLYKFKNKMDLY